MNKGWKDREEVNDIASWSRRRAGPDLGMRRSVEAPGRPAIASWRKRNKQVVKVGNLRRIRRNCRCMLKAPGTELDWLRALSEVVEIAINDLRISLQPKAKSWANKFIL
jgi:hypothetical protein